VKFEGRFRIPAPRAEVFEKLNDPHFFASCLEGVSDLKEIDENNFKATLETRIAYIKFSFAVAVTLVERIAPERIVARIDGQPLGTVGRLTSFAEANLIEAEDGRETDIVYVMDVAMTGKLGSLGQPVMKSKAREMEQGFVRNASKAFAAPDKPAAADQAEDYSETGLLAAIRRFVAAITSPLASRRSEEAAQQAALIPQPPRSREPNMPVGAVRRGAAARTSLDFDMVTARTVEEAVHLLAEGGPSVRAFSGGTGLMLMMKTGVFKPTRLVDLTGLEGELSEVRMAADGSLYIGALTRLADLGRSPLLLEQAPAIPLAMPRLSNVRVRNAARVGGALAHGDPHMDLPPVLAVLGGRVEIAGPTGNRQVPLDEFYLGYYTTVLGEGELITGVHLPSQAGWQSIYRKTTIRTYDDWPALGVAASLRFDDGLVGDLRLAVSAATEKLTRLDAIEALVRGNKLSAELCREAGRQAGKGLETTTDIHGSAGYKKVLVEAEVTAALETFLSTGQAK